MNSMVINVMLQDYAIKASWDMDLRIPYAMFYKVVTADDKR